MDRTCSVCGETKPIGLFRQHKPGKYASFCKVCRNAKERASYADDPEPQRARTTKWNRDNREARLEYSRNYSEINREEINRKRRERYWEKHEESIAVAAEFRDRNRDYVNEYHREWLRNHPGRGTEYARRTRAKNPEISRRACRKRDALRRGAPVVEEIDRWTVYTRDKGICYLCGVSVDPKKYTLDHLIPLSKGGDHTYANIQLAHGHCNSSKGNRSIARAALVRLADRLV